jgi:CYTH domain-containing protein
MQTTVEHRYLLKPETKGWRGLRSEAMRIQQGYLYIRNNQSVYVSLEYANQASLCFRKENLGTPDVRFKFRIPRGLGNILFKLCGKRVLKRTRHQVIDNERVWRINEFSGNLRGLILVEVTLGGAEAEIEKPAWAAADVTYESEYTFAQLAKHGIPKKSQLAERG